MIKIFRNATELTNIIIDTPYKDTIDEELDKLTFQIKSTSRITNWKKNEKITYQLTQNNIIVISKDMALFDYVETYECEYWLYQLTLLSPTKILDNIIINGMAETYCPLNNQSLYQQLVRVVDKINAQLSYELGTNTITLHVDTSLNNSNNDNYIGNVASNDFLWNGQLTAREILQDILDKADMLVICDDYNYANGSITYLNITAIKREKKANRIVNSIMPIERGGLNEIASVIKGITIHRDSEFNSGNIISLIKNGISKDNVQQSYLPARNDDMTIDDASDWHIITQEPIYSLDKDLGCKVIAMIPIEVSINYWYYENDAWHNVLWTTPGGYGLEQPLLPVDITEYIVEKDVFDALPTKEQKKRLYFKRGEKGIYGLYKRYKDNPLWSNTALYNIVDDLFPFYNITGGKITYYINSNDVVNWNDYGNPPLLRYENNSVEEWNPTVSGHNIHISSSGNKEDGAIRYFQMEEAPKENQIKYSLFSVNYQPYCNSVVKIEKTATIDGNVNNLSVIKNQSDETIDNEKYYKSQQALINRLGNEEMTIDCMFKMNENTVWNLGDYMTIEGRNWTLTERTISCYGDDYLKATMVFSKNYNARNSAINVNRDKRLYGIPLNQFVDRYLIIKGIPYYIKKLLIKSYDDFTPNQSESTNYTDVGYTLLELITIYQNDRVARCKDNYAVAVERTKYSNTIVNVNLRYCDKSGYATNIYLKYLAEYLFNLYSISDYSRLPFIKDYDDPHATTKVLENIYKDKMERLIFVLKP